MNKNPLIPGCFPVLNLTFMNASNPFWCARPAALVDAGVSVERWKEISGQNDGDGCKVYDLNYTRYRWGA